MNEAVAAIRTQVDAWIVQSIELRQLDLPGVGDAPAAFHASRMVARAQLDRLEEILSQAMALHGMVTRRYEAAKDEAADAWEKEAARRKHTGVDGDYVSGKEREAYCNLATREQRLAVRELRELQSFVREALDRLWLKYNGLRGTKGDLADELKYLTWESHLER